MNIELVVIGNEVLSGSTINTNAAFIGKILFESGYKLTKQTVLPDGEKQLREGIEDALSRNDLVITTGGLGPTIDDISRKVVAEIFDSPFHFNKEVANELEERFGKKFPTMEDQATVPSKAEILPNPVGTAPGFIFQSEKGTLIMVPGVPHEMERMTVEQVIPFMEKSFPLTLRPYRKAIYFSQTPEFKVDPVLRELKNEYPSIDFGIYPSLGQLTVQLTSYVSAKELEAPLKVLKEKFSQNIYQSELGKIEDAVQTLFISNRWTLSSAESCTGGSVAARLTQLPGASEYFLGSIVSYSNSVKTTALGVSQELIKEHGAVSPKVVEAMVEGVQRLTNSDFSIAVSGIAGPSGGTPEKPVGTVWFALKKRGEKPLVWTSKCFGSRYMIITHSTNELLSKLYHYVKE